MPTISRLPSDREQGGSTAARLPPMPARFCWMGADRAIGMMKKFAAGFHDERRAHLVEQEVETLVGQRVFATAATRT
jgi:hypothetical protein